MELLHQTTTQEFVNVISSPCLSTLCPIINYSTIVGFPETPPFSKRRVPRGRSIERSDSATSGFSVIFLTVALDVRGPRLPKNTTRRHLDIAPSPLAA